MHHNINILNPIDYQGWDDLLLSREGYTFFHSVAWAKVLSETYHYRPLYFTLLDDNRLLALIPMMEVRSVFTGLRGVSLPFTDFCEPLFADGVNIQDILDFIKQYGRDCHWESIESRGDNFPGKVALTSFYRHTLNLTPGIEQIFSRFKCNTRNGIRKAVRDGVEINICSTLKAVNEYYRLHCLTRKRHGLPPQPYSFFKKIYEHIISQNLGLVVLASIDKTNIAGSIYFHFKNKSIYKFSASDYKYKHVNPVDLVMWEAIKWYTQNGHHSLCFGRTSLDNRGLRYFKSRWGTEEQIINYYKYNLRTNSFVTKKRSPLKDSHNRILRKMPIPLLKVLGSMLYKHVG